MKRLTANGLGPDCGVKIGLRSLEGRQEFAAYAAGAIEVPGPETALLADLAKELHIQLVLGVVERAASTLYFTALGFDERGYLRGRHRKVMPTAMERVIWGCGDGSTLDVWGSPVGRLGAVICWENYMPLLRAAMYAKEIQLYCAPTVDDRDTWLPTMRHIAVEGRCFVLSACQYRRSDTDPLGHINGGSCIVDPLGKILAGPAFGVNAILTATIDPDLLLAGKFDLDVAGHHARPDIFELRIDHRPKRGFLETEADPE